MPQKLPPNVRYDATGEPLERRPGHAQLIARIAAAWATVEFLMAHVLGQMLRAESKSALALYSTLSNNRAGRSAITAVADATLPALVAKHLSKLMAEAKRRADERNRIVHALWATTDDLPDILICADSRNHLRRLAHHRAMQLYGTTDREELFTTIETNDFGYKIQDLQNTLRRIVQLRAKLADFSAELDPGFFETPDQPIDPSPPEEGPARR